MFSTLLTICCYLFLKFFPYGSYTLDNLSIYDELHPEVSISRYNREYLGTDGSRVKSINSLFFWEANKYTRIEISAIGYETKVVNIAPRKWKKIWSGCSRHHEVNWYFISENKILLRRLPLSEELISNMTHILSQKNELLKQNSKYDTEKHQVIDRIKDLNIKSPKLTPPLISLLTDSNFESGSRAYIKGQLKHDDLVLILIQQTGVDEALQILINLLPTIKKENVLRNTIGRLAVFYDKQKCISPNLQILLSSLLKDSTLSLDVKYTILDLFSEGSNFNADILFKIYQEIISLPINEDNLYIIKYNKLKLIEAFGYSSNPDSQVFSILNKEVNSEDLDISLNSILSLSRLNKLDSTIFSKLISWANTIVCYDSGNIRFDTLTKAVAKIKNIDDYSYKFRDELDKLSLKIAKCCEMHHIFYDEYGRLALENIGTAKALEVAAVCKPN